MQCSTQARAWPAHPRSVTSCDQRRVATRGCESCQNGAVSVTMTLEPDRAQQAFLTLSLCFLTSMFEGLDLQSMGVAAPALGPEFHLTREQLGVVAAASPLGLLFGAFIGGRVADLWGRKGALLLSTVVFGVFQLVTSWATGYGSLVAIRFACGLGLGGAMPTLIALTSEVSGGRNDILNV